MIQLNTCTLCHGRLVLEDTTMGFRFYVCEECGHEVRRPVEKEENEHAD